VYPGQLHILRNVLAYPDFCGLKPTDTTYLCNATQFLF